MKLLSAIVCAGLAWAQPAAPPARWTPLIGEYHRDYGIFHVYEKDGRLTIMVDRMFEYPLTELGPRRFRFPAKGMYPGAEVEFAPEGLRVGGTLFRRLPDPSAPGATFRITPLRPIDELREQARRAAPPHP